MDVNRSASPAKGPRSTLVSWANPDAESSWPVLWTSTVVWSLLTVVWVLYLLLADVETYRLFLYPVLALVAVLQVVSNVVAMRRKRKQETALG